MKLGRQRPQGQLANLLSNFGQSLAAFFTRIWATGSPSITLVTMSELGRTHQHENGNRGTDHGHANYMMVLGGSIQGGKVYGDWPGLPRSNCTSNTIST